MRVQPTLGTAASDRTARGNRTSVQCTWGPPRDNGQWPITAHICASYDCAGAGDCKPGQTYAAGNRNSEPPQTDRLVALIAMGHLWNFFRGGTVAEFGSALTIPRVSKGGIGRGRNRHPSLSESTRFQFRRIRDHRRASDAMWCSPQAISTNGCRGLVALERATIRNEWRSADGPPKSSVSERVWGEVECHGSLDRCHRCGTDVRVCANAPATKMAWQPAAWESPRGRCHRSRTRRQPPLHSNPEELDAATLGQQPGPMATESVGSRECG